MLSQAALPYNPIYDHIYDDDDDGDDSDNDDEDLYNDNTGFMCVCMLIVRNG